MFHHFVPKNVWRGLGPHLADTAPPEKQVLVLDQFWLRISTGNQNQDNYKLRTIRYEVQPHFAVCTHPDSEVTKQNKLCNASMNRLTEFLVTCFSHRVEFLVIYFSHLTEFLVICFSHLFEFLVIWLNS